MTVTDCNIRVMPRGPMGLLAVGFLVFDEELRLNDLELWQDKQGVHFIKWPSRGGHRPHCQPLTRALYDQAVNAMLGAYTRAEAGAA